MPLWGAAGDRREELNEIKEACSEPPNIAGRAGGCYSDGPWALQPLASHYYWSSSSDVAFPSGAWGVSMGSGNDVPLQPHVARQSLEMEPAGQGEGSRAR